MIRNDLAPVISLDGRWELLAGEKAAGRYCRSRLLGSPRIPHDAWMARCATGVRFTFRPRGPTSRPYAEFDAVSYAATYAAMAYCRRALGLWTPFACDVTAAIRPGEENVLEVDVIKPCHRLTGGRYPHAQHAGRLSARRGDDLRRAVAVGPT